MRLALPVLLLLSLLASGNALALAAGDKAPDFSGTQLDNGKPLKLSALRGKVVYVDFWASWCAPCRQSLPLLSGMRKDLVKQGFEVVGINLDEDEQAAKRAAAAGGVNYPVLRGTSEAVAKAYGMKDMPSGYVIDRKGRVHSVHGGFRVSEFPALRAEIEQLLKGKGKP